MALRLYRGDSFLWRFSARVRERCSYEGRPAVTLDQTAFYPTSGGQPFDAGALNGVAVVEVVERPDGEIVHVLAGPLSGDEVQGEIDSARRLDHMQQHSGQHVLSQAFVRVADLDTIAVHIGADECTIDLPSLRLAPGVAEQAEDEANRIIVEDRPFIVREMSDAEVAQLPLRKPPKVTGQIRIVEVQDYDWSACGGTHVRAAGQIGVIKITRVEKRGDNTRVYFRCGRRALLDYRGLNNLVAALVDVFRLGRAELLPAVERLREEARSAHKELADARARLLEYEAQEMLRTAPANARPRVIARVLADRDATTLKFMAKRLTSEPSVIALLGSRYEDRIFLCFARSADASPDMNALLRGALNVLATAGARGGGSAEFAQGGAPAGGVPVAEKQPLEAALNWATTQVER